MGQQWMAVVQHARSPGYDLVLLAHVLAVIASFGSVAVAGAFAVALTRPHPIRDSVVRYYRPGVNWAGRILFAVPVLGFILMGMSHGDWTFSDRWIAIGLVLWVAAASLAEMALWPGERRIQEAVASLAPVGGRDGSSAGMASEPAAGLELPVEARGLCWRMAALSAVVAAILVTACVVMVAKP